MANNSWKILHNDTDGGLKTTKMCVLDVRKMWLRAEVCEYTICVLNKKPHRRLSYLIIPSLCFVSIKILVI
jgi:hypothetical protein